MLPARTSLRSAPSPAVLHFDFSRLRPRADNFAERRDQPPILLGQPDAYPHMPWIAVTVHRTHDHALAQQRVVDGTAVADIHQEKIRMTRHERQPEARELALEVIHPLGVHLQRP